MGDWPACGDEICEITEEWDDDDGVDDDDGGYPEVEAEHEDESVAGWDAVGEDGEPVELGRVQKVKLRWKKFDRILKGLFRFQPPLAAERDPSWARSRAGSQISINVDDGPAAADIFLRVRQQCNDPFFNDSPVRNERGQTLFRRPASYAEQPSEIAASQRRSSALRQAAFSFGGQPHHGRESPPSLSGVASVGLRQSLLDSQVMLGTLKLPAGTGDDNNDQ